MNLPTVKNALKFFIGMVIVAAIGTGVLYGLNYLPFPSSGFMTESETEKFAKEWTKLYEEDQYGGSTPEETLQLFINALKRGDTELAAKYFIIDKQEEWKADLARMKEKEFLDEMIRDLEKAKRGNDIDETYSRYIVANDRKEVITIINLSKNQEGKWKLLDF